jgi:hypothetical protein
MNIADALLRAYGKHDGPMYTPVVFRELSPADESAIRAVCASYMPEAVRSTFNTWYISKSGRGFCVRRATWDDSQWREDVEGVCMLIRGYYTIEAPPAGA